MSLDSASAAVVLAEVAQKLTAALGKLGPL
jgi:hypothetical protein